ncbi:UvrB/uvrC motif protein [bacterium BMS3Abin04]|nr:UvrB/uvrC motif protein [bacterium BMS3Abin04]
MLLIYKKKYNHIIFNKCNNTVNKVQVEILGLSSSPSTGGAYALLLKEAYGIRRLPIIIGSFEAQSIALEIEGIKPPRPLTHDLMKSLVDNLGASVNEIIIDELKENTFYAKIIIETSGITTEIDARPSDAIALAVRTGASIYVSEDVMKTAAFIPTGEEAESDLANSTNPDIIPNESTGKPKSKETLIASLMDKLRESVDKEDYERAAKLRDEINRLKGSTN